MHTALPFFLLAATIAGVDAVQQEGTLSRAPKKGETIVVKGCLTGQALQATDLGSGEVRESLSSEMTFRLTGDKTLLKQLKAGHDGNVVEVQGVLKSELPKESTATRKVGKMRITFGTPSEAPLSREAETRRSLPV